MKKVVLIFLVVFSLVSCSLDDGDNSLNFYPEVLPIEEFDIPVEFQIGQTYEIKVWYRVPSTCHVFDKIYYEKDLNIRTIAVQTIVTERDDCTNYSLQSELAEASFDFYVTNNGSYIFKFWKGIDDNGEDLFYEVEVPVID